MAPWQGISFDQFFPADDSPSILRAIRRKQLGEIA
jgi:hypothetical protein